ncbi:unnamed protein product [Phytophthora fragariaefolia]|uniref:Unnamed protein product n=1 Tax=Phytophthora fragariaefolia TaxID=1490495 RepID=A0A9W6YHJ9_9STRA|nr:unnamed protein product [Phytophthora fragariaefolia]
MEHQADGIQHDQFMQAIERIAASLSLRMLTYIRIFSRITKVTVSQQWQHQVQRCQEQQAQREYKVEGISMPTFYGRLSKTVDEFIFRAKLFMQGKSIDYTEPHNGPRVVAVLPANLRDGAASWSHAKVMVEQVEFSDIDDLKAAQTRGSVDDYAKEFRRIIAQIHGMHSLDQVDHFCGGQKSETRKEAMYLRCATLAAAIASVQAFESKHFSSERVRSSRLRDAISPGLGEEPSPMDLSVVDSRQIDKRMCRERHLCFYSSSFEIMELSTVSVGPSTPFLTTVFISDKPFRMLIDSGSSRCIVKDGVMGTSQMSIIQVSACGFDGGTQQRLVPTCELTVDCASVQ